MAEMSQRDHFVSGQQVAFTAPETVVMEEMAVEAPGDYEILVRTERSLISAGTELSNLLGQLSVFRGYPVYPGYSNVGIVVAVGDRVEQPAVGQRIVSMGRHASHFKLNLSPDRPGGPHYWQAVPDAVSAEEAAFAVLGSVALHSVRKAELQLGQSVVVVGAGVVGQLITQFVYWSGCQPITVLDLYDQRLALARQSGADFTINPQATDPVAAVMEITKGRGADAVFEATRSARTLPMMMMLAAQSGKLMVVGSLPGAVEIDPFTELQLKELQVIGCFQPASPIQGHAYFPWTQQRNRQIFLDLLESGKLKVQHLITHRMPFTAAPEAYAMIRQGGDWLGVVFAW
jgi:2-desacetyl-2-hydroxyethyl bacteriochlorophyllide A dehydrogenase